MCRRFGVGPSLLLWLSPLLLWFLASRGGVDSAPSTGCNIKIRLKTHQRSTILMPKYPKFLGRATTPFPGPAHSTSRLTPLVASFGHSTRCSFLTTRTLFTYLLLQSGNTCYRRRPPWAGQRCRLVELIRRRQVSDQTVAPSRHHRTEKPRRVRLALTARCRLVEGTVRPGRGPASRQRRAEPATLPSCSSVGRRAPWSELPCRGRPPTAIEPTRSVESLAGTSDDLSITQ